MPLFKIGKNFAKPIGRPDVQYVRCATCDRIEGQFVLATNRLMVGIGVEADKARTRGWRFEDEQWLCPAC